MQIWANCEIEKNEIAFRMSIYFTRKEDMLKVLRFFSSKILSLFGPIVGVLPGEGKILQI